MSEWRAQLWQNGIVVAAVSGPDGERVQREIQHYAAQYVSEGPVRIKMIPPRPALSQAVSQTDDNSTPRKT